MSASASAWTSVPVSVKNPEVVSERVVLEVVKRGIPAMVMASATAFVDVGVMDWDFEQSMINYLSMLMVLWLSKTTYIGRYGRTSWRGSATSVVDFFIMRCSQGFPAIEDEEGPSVSDHEGDLSMPFLPSILLDYLLIDEETSTQLFERLDKTMDAYGRVRNFVGMLCERRNVYADHIERSTVWMPSYEWEEREIVDEDSMCSFLYSFHQRVKQQFSEQIDGFLKWTSSVMITDEDETETREYFGGQWLRLTEEERTTFVELVRELLEQNDYGNMFSLLNLMILLERDTRYEMEREEEEEKWDHYFGSMGGQRGP